MRVPTLAKGPATLKQRLFGALKNQKRVAAPGQLNLAST